MKCKWLPQLYEYPDWNNYAEYESKLYTFFKKLYWYNSVYFNDKKLVLKKYPMDSNTNREESFYHFSCKVYKEAGETSRKARSQNRSGRLRHHPKKFLPGEN